MKENNIKCNTLIREISGNSCICNLKRYHFIQTLNVKFTIFVARVKEATQKDLDDCMNWKAYLRSLEIINKRI